MYKLKYCLNFLSSMLATCFAEHSPPDFITVLISYEEYDYELSCSVWIQLTNISAFAHFCNLKHEFNYTVANIFVPRTIQYVGILSPMSLSCLVYTNERPNWHKVLRHDYLIFIVQVLLSCCVKLRVRMPHVVLRKHSQQLEMSAKHSEKSNKTITRSYWQFQAWSVFCLIGYWFQCAVCSMCGCFDMCVFLWWTS